MADIIQIRDYQNRKDLDRPNEETLEQQAVRVLHLALNDTAPSEYTAPDDDCA